MVMDNYATAVKMLIDTLTALPIDVLKSLPFKSPNETSNRHIAEQRDGGMS